MRFPIGLYHDDPPYIMAVSYVVNGEHMWTERYWGEGNDYSPYNLPREFDLVNASDIRIFIYANKVRYTLTARAQIEWACLDFDPDYPMSNKLATNTWQMANAVLTNDFKPIMAENYGCAGRGLFDAFGPTVGSVTDDIDAAFLTWKKCVKCASGENEDHIVPYLYDVHHDSCGGKPYKDSKQDFCECDRALMKVLKNAQDDTGYSMYPSNQCTHPCTYPCKRPWEPLTCCRWNENFWAAYNPDIKCCSSTGLLPIGTC